MLILRRSANYRRRSCFSSDMRIVKVAILDLQQVPGSDDDEMLRLGAWHC